MIQDAQQLYSDAQALSGTGAASTNIIDHGPGAERRLGTGEPMAAVITVDAALAGTSPTFQASVQSDDAAGFGSAVTVAVCRSYTALATGAKVVIPIPPGDPTERYTRINYVLGGTSPTITVTASLMPMSMIQNDAVYADGFVIQ